LVDCITEARVVRRRLCMNHPPALVGLEICFDLFIRADNQRLRDV